MNQRRRVQELHERFNVRLFLKEFNARYHADFKVIEEPNPPEAIIQSKSSIRWVEVTTAYLSEEYAIDLNTYAVEGEKHKPRRQAVYVDSDEQFAEQFVRTVSKKLEKVTYEPFFREHGKGYLVVSIKDPLFGQSILGAIQKAWDETEVVDKGFFKSIYIVYPVFGEYKVSLWKSNLS
ncbi:MAG: hypothetical protein ACKE5M_05390 [Methylophilaceae bacterium]